MSDHGQTTPSPEQPRPGRRRVVVTGMGALTPLGNSVTATWDAAITGASGIELLTLVDTTNYDCKVGGEVRDFDPNEYMDRKDARRMARFSQFAVATARQAVADANLDLDTIDRTRVGIVLGNGGGGMPNTDAAMHTIIERGGARLDPLFIAKMLSNMAAGNVTIQLGLHGYSNTVSTACAAGTQAIGDATEVIRRGAADVMLAGGSEAGISELGLAGFSSMRALTTANTDHPHRASRPFDRDRDGFAPAEGAGILVLEGLDHALARGATILAEISGYGVSADATFLVAPPEDGRGGAQAMRAALTDAALDPAAVDYISAHATATEQGDIAETRAIHSVFGDHAPRIPVTAFKSQVGHILGGSGGVETMMVVQSLLHGRVPPTVNLDTPDPACDLDYVPEGSRAVDIRVAMKNSFGFGGQNAVLVLERWDGE